MYFASFLTLIYLTVQSDKECESQSPLLYFFSDGFTSHTSVIEKYAGWERHTLDMARYNIPINFNEQASTL